VRTNQNFNASQSQMPHQIFADAPPPSMAPVMPPPPPPPMQMQMPRMQMPPGMGMPPMGMPGQYGLPPPPPVGWGKPKASIYQHFCLVLRRIQFLHSFHYRLGRNASAAFFRWICTTSATTILLEEDKLSGDVFIVLYSFCFYGNK